MIYKKLYNIITLLCIAGVFLTSCLKEDRSNCSDTGLWVRFSHETDDELKSGAKSDFIPRAVLYIFDKNDNYMTACVFDEPQMNTDIEIPNWRNYLTVGEPYQFIVWYNVNSPFSTNPSYEDFQVVKPNKKEATLFMEIPDNRIVDFDLPFLSFGINTEKIRADKQVVNIDLVQNVNTIYFTVNGLAPNTDTYLFKIKDNNNIYDFDNNIKSKDNEGMFDYTAISEFTNNSQSLESKMMTLQLANDRHPIFTLYDQTTNDLLYPSYSGQENDLIKMINDAYGNAIDFTRRDIFHVTINFDTNMTATVDIDGWEMKESSGGLVP